MHDADRQRELKKQLLLTRSAAERAELAHAITTVRQSATVFGKDVPALAMGRGLPLALGLLKRAPLLSPLLSLALAGARKPALRYAALAAGAAWLTWKGWQGLAARRVPPAAPPEEAPSSAQDAPE